MTKNRLLLVAALFAITAAPRMCGAQDMFEPMAVKGDTSFVTPTIESATSQDFGTNDSHLVRNCLVVAGLGITFCIGMAITATTIYQNRPSTPRQTSYFAS